MNINEINEQLENAIGRTAGWLFPFAAKINKRIKEKKNADHQKDQSAPIKIDESSVQPPTGSVGTDH